MGQKNGIWIDPTFDQHFMEICHITLTSDEISFQAVLLSPCLHKSCLEGPSHWKGTLDVFYYARTACHSALAIGIAIKIKIAINRHIVKSGVDWIGLHL